MILGEVLAKIGKKPLATLLQNKVLEPLGLKNTIESRDVPDPGPVPALVQRRAARLLRRPADHTVLRGRDVLEHAVGDTDRREPGHEDRRHDQDRDRHRERQAPVEDELPRDDRPQPAGLRPQDPGVHARVLHRRPRPTTSASGSCGRGTGSSRTRCSPASPRSRPTCRRRRSPSPSPTRSTSPTSRTPNPNLASNPSNVLFQEIAAELAPNDAPPTAS